MGTSQSVSDDEEAIGLGKRRLGSPPEPEDSLAKLRAEIEALACLPIVLDGSEGPPVVRLDAVMGGAARMLGILETLSEEAEQTAARLERYARLKKYTRQLERVAKFLKQRLAILGELAGEGLP